MPCLIDLPLAFYVAHSDAAQEAFEESQKVLEAKPSKRKALDVVSEEDPTKRPKKKKKKKSKRASPLVTSNYPAKSPIRDVRSPISSSTKFPTQQSS